MEKAKKQEWKEKETALIVAAKEVGVEKQAVVAAKIQLETDRANISRSLKDALAKLQAEGRGRYDTTAAVPDTMLWDAIRTVSRELSSTIP